MAATGYPVYTVGLSRTRARRADQRRRSAVAEGRGFIGTFSGPYAEANAALDASIAAFIKVHGAAVAGRKLEIIKRDDGGLAPDTARYAWRKS